MARHIKRLSARKAKTAKPPKERDKVFFADGGGLYLQVSRSDDGTAVRRSWVFRYQLDHKRRELGLGALDTTSLGEARDIAHRYRRQLRDGIDPLAAKRSLAQQRRLEAIKAMTFGQCCAEFLTAHDVWQNGKHRQQWRSTLATYCAPLNDLPVKDIDTDLVLRVLTPIWKTKNETARRLRARIQRVLALATARGVRSGPNPAAWEGHLCEMLPGKLKQPKHHAALPYPEMPTLMHELRRRDSLSARALEFNILTATRTAELLGARWDEVNFAEKLWTVPASRTKARREHRIPLSDRALAILKGLPHTSDRIFNLSNMAMLQLLRGMRPGLTVHGTARSSFRDFAGNETNFSRETAEAALAHTVGDKAEQAYRRSDALQKRRKLMDSWASFCSRPPLQKGSNVVTPLRRKASAQASA